MLIVLAVTFAAGIPLADPALAGRRAGPAALIIPDHPFGGGQRADPRPADPDIQPGRTGRRDIITELLKSVAGP